MKRLTLAENLSDEVYIASSHGFIVFTLQHSGGQLCLLPVFRCIGGPDIYETTSVL
jgi:hypothetical protein